MLELGLGAAEVLRAGGRGTVVAVFSKAAYLRLPGGLVALTTDEAPSGPIHARGRFDLARLEAGDAMTVDGSVAGLDLDSAQVWEGELPAPADLERGAGVALDVLRSAPPSALDAFGPQVTAAAEHLGRGHLAGAVEALTGLGPGLTPAGDDALAGVLLIERVRRGTAPAEVAAARTNDVAGAFLAWAARGQCISPVHRFLGAAAGKDTAGATAALRSLLRFGQSSGADLALGLRLAFAQNVAKTA